MRIRLTRLKSAGGIVAAAWFIGDKNESFYFGDVPEDLSTEVEADDYQPLPSCRFVVSGSVLKKNQFRETTISHDSPFEETGNLKWCRFTILEDNTIGFCLDMQNTRYRLVKPHRLNLTPDKSVKLAVFGYLCAAEGEIVIDGKEIEFKEVVSLTGAEIEITAGPAGAQVGVLEVEYT
jgi:hypothetical protein